MTTQGVSFQGLLGFPWVRRSRLRAFFLGCLVIGEYVGVMGDAHAAPA